MDYKELFIKSLSEELQLEENPTRKASIEKVIEIIKTQSLYQAAIYDFLAIRIPGLTYDDLYKIPDIRQAFLDMINNPSLESPKQDMFAYDVVDVLKDWLSPEILLNDKEILEFIKNCSFEQAKRFFGGRYTNALFADKTVYEVIKNKATTDARFYSIMDYSEHSLKDGTCKLIALHDNGGRKLINEDPETQIIVIKNLDPETNMEFFLMSFNTYKPEVKQAIMEFAPLVEQLILKHTNRYLTEALIKKEYEETIVTNHLEFIKELSYEQKLSFVYNMQNPEMQKYLIQKLKIMDNLLSHPDFGDFFKGIKDHDFLVESICNLDILKKMDTNKFRMLLPYISVETQKKIYNHPSFQEYIRKHTFPYQLMNIIASFNEEIIDIIVPLLKKIEITDYLILYRSTLNPKYITAIINELDNQKENNLEDYEENLKYIVSQFLGMELAATLSNEHYQYFLSHNKEVHDLETALSYIDKYFIPNEPKQEDFDIVAPIKEIKDLTKQQKDALTNVRLHEVYKVNLEKALRYIRKIDGRVITKLSYEILNQISAEDRQIILDHMEIESLINYIAASKYILDYVYDLYEKDPTLFDNIEQKEDSRVRINGDQLEKAELEKLTKLFYKVPDSTQEQLINATLLSNEEILSYVKDKISKNPNVYSGSIYTTIDKYLTPEELEKLLEGLSLTNFITYNTHLTFETLMPNANNEIKNKVLLARKDEVIHEVNTIEFTAITSITTSTIIEKLYNLVSNKEEYLRALKPSLLLRIFDQNSKDKKQTEKNKIILKILREQPYTLISAKEKDIKDLLSKLSKTELTSLISKYNTTDLIELFAKSQNKDIEETLMNAYNQNSLFINNTSLSIEEILSKLEEDNKNKIYAEIDNEFNNLELPDGIRDKLKKLSYDEKLFLIYGVKKNIFNEEKYELIKTLLQQDPFALNSLNINLLSDDIFNISKNIIPKIYRYENLTIDYISLIKKNTVRSRLLLLIIEYLNKTTTNETVYIQKLDTIINYLSVANDRNIDRYNLNNINEQELYELIEYILIDSTDYVIDTSIMAQPNIFISRENPHNCDTFTDIEKYRMLDLDKKVDTETDLTKCKNILFEKYFKIDLEQAEFVIHRYGTSLENIFKYINNKDVLKLINDINYILGLNDINEIKEIYYSNEFKYNIEDYLYMYDELTQAYNKSIAEDIKGYKNGHEKPLAILLENELAIVNAIELETDFDLFVHSTDAYGSMEMINDNYFDSWNYSDKTSNHGICTSYISNSNLGTAKVKGKGVMFGFVNLNQNSISSLAPYDLVSRNEGIITVTKRPPMFVDTKTLADHTRHTHNEAVLERRNVSSDSKFPVIQPDCIIIFEEMDATIKANAIRAQRDFKAQGVDIPIIYINRRKVVELEARRVEEMIKLFQEKPNIQLLGEIINKYESNRCGLDFEENLNPEELFNKEKIYQLLSELIDSIIKNKDKENAINLIQMIEQENSKFTIIKENIGNRAHSFDLLDQNIKTKLETLKELYVFEDDIASNYSI